jgi:protein-L-isoaspartate(D-aspartate) O-methyltransferase
MNNTEIAKFNMIEQQIRPWEVLDHQVLSVLEGLNREDFVDPAYRGLAYADCQIPLGHGVRMLPPTVEGRMLQALVLASDDQVLEVGSGSGYISACLAALAGQVRSIDANADIIERARANVDRLGPGRVEFEQMSLHQLDAPASYDAIAVTASLPTVPQNLKQALKIGGRMFVICGHSPVMEALLITRVGASEWTTQSLFETDLPRLQVTGS